MSEGNGLPQKQEVEEKEQRLRQSIAINYSHIKSVENQLAELQLQLNLTSGPKKSALEMLRRKIEAKNELVAAARQKFAAAKQIAEEAEEVLRAHERSKEQLCQELNLLVHQSATAELNKLEQLTQQLESLNGGKLVHSAEGAEVGKALMHQQAIAGNLPSAEDAAAVTTEQQARASSSAVPSAPASSTATPSQVGNGSAAVSNMRTGSGSGSIYPGQHSSEPQQAGQIPQAAQGNVGAIRNSTSEACKQSTRGMGQAHVTTPQAASDSAGRFQGFE